MVCKAVIQELRREAAALNSQTLLHLMAADLAHGPIRYFCTLQPAVFSGQAAAGIAVDNVSALVDEWVG